MKELKIVFMGTAELSCASLAALAGDRQFSVAAVVTQPDRPKGRELKLQPSPVKTLAQKLDRPVLQPAKARDGQFIAELGRLNPDLIVVVAYGHILPQTILDLPRYGCLNVHTSLLPKYRGAAPIQWAIAHGDAETGVTLMKMDAGLDTGPIVAQRRTPIRPADDSATLHDRLAQLGAELLGGTIPDYIAGKIQPRPQPAEGVSLAPKIKKEDGRIDWRQPAQTIVNRLRAFTPWPGAFTFLLMEGAAPSVPLSGTSQGSDEAPPSRMIKIWKAEPAEASGEAGTILSADKSGMVVGCGRGALRILEMQREGGRRMNAAEFLAGHPLKAGGKFER
ncbi:MAG TPA: methionyl-tRNA formyltransferase [Verrucomicrobiae bacterium]|nr:methionyl-tRNA formyltransferase [Verrucomicrobiae bacterium]